MTITGIPSMILGGGSIFKCNVALRMSWASKRRTTRDEDMAYCLMGIFKVNMPLLYGEGGEKAFVRLQEEILKITDDHSIFIWTGHTDVQNSGLLARSPASFCTCFRCWLNLCQDTNLDPRGPYGKFTPVEDIRSEFNEPTIPTSRGVKISLLVRQLEDDDPWRTSWIACLDLAFPGQKRLGIRLKRVLKASFTFYRMMTEPERGFRLVDVNAMDSFERRTLFIRPMPLWLPPVIQEDRTHKSRTCFFFLPLPDYLSVSHFGFLSAMLGTWLWYEGKEWDGESKNGEMGIILLRHHTCDSLKDHGGESLVVVFGYLDKRRLVPFCHMQLMPSTEPRPDPLSQYTELADSLASRKSFTYSDRASVLLDCGHFVSLSIRKSPLASDAVDSWTFFTAVNSDDRSWSFYTLSLSIGAPPQGDIRLRMAELEAASRQEKFRLVETQSTASDDPSSVLVELA